MGASWIGDTGPAERWRSRAECRPGNGYEPETWFPRPPNPYATRQERREATERRKRQEQRAKEICEICPVTNECYESALRHDERSGIWGGKTPEERGVKPIR